MVACSIEWRKIYCLVLTGIPLVCIMSLAHCLHFVAMMYMMVEQWIWWKCKSGSKRQAQDCQSGRGTGWHYDCGTPVPVYYHSIRFTYPHTISTKTTTIFSTFLLPLYGIKHKTAPGQNVLEPSVSQKWTKANVIQLVLWLSSKNSIFHIPYSKSIVRSSIPYPAWTPSHSHFQSTQPLIAPRCYIRRRHVIDWFMPPD